MHQLLTTEESYRRLSSLVTARSDIKPIFLDQQGLLTMDGKTVPASEIDLTMARVDLELFMTGHVEFAVKLIAAATDLQFVQTSAAGLDHPMFRMFADKASNFCNSDAQAPAIAEYVVACVLNRWHRFDIRAQYQQGRRWEVNEFKEIFDSNWLIIGFGNIGQRVARQVNGFGGHVTAIRRNTSPHELAETVDTLEHLSKYLGDTDVVVLACALNEETRQLVNEAFFEELNPDAVLVNIGRGDLVDENALIKALDSGWLEYAVLDVFATEPLPEDSVFWHHEKVLVTAHSSNRGLGTNKRGDDLFVANLLRFLAGDPLINLVDPASF